MEMPERRQTMLRTPSFSRAEVTNFARDTMGLRRSFSEQTRGQVLINSVWSELAMGVVIFLNAGLIIYETDHPVEVEPPWRVCASYTFLGIYCLELILRLWVYGASFCKSKWNLLDFFVVAFDCTGTVLNAFADGSLPSMSVLRALRVIRLVRFVKVLTLFKELHVMLFGVGAAVKAIFWSAILMGIGITLCSIVAVNVIHPINADLAAQGVYGDCERCGRAFKTVGESNLTFIQQIIAGDSWGQISIPIIEENAWTAVFFLFVFSMINLGFLNLVMSVIVACSQEAVERDNEFQLSVQAHEYEQAKVKVLKMCDRMDSDQDGLLSHDEIRAGMDNDVEFRTTIAILGSEDDVEFVIRSIDRAHDGHVTYKEFVDYLYKLKTDGRNHELITHTKLRIMELESSIEAKFASLQLELSQKIDRQSHAIEQVWKSITGTEPVFAVDFVDSAPPCLDNECAWRSVQPDAGNLANEESTIPRDFSDIGVQLKLIRERIDQDLLVLVENVMRTANCQGLCKSRLGSAKTSDAGPVSLGVCGEVCREAPTPALRNSASGAKVAGRLPMIPG